MIPLPLIRSLRRNSFALILGVFWVCLGSAAWALDLGRGPVPLEVEPPRGSTFEAGDELIVEGTVSGSGAVVILLRIDDGQSKDWASRYNREQTFGPGSFRFRLSLDEIRTQAGRTLDARDLRRIVVARLSGTANVTVDRASIGKPAAPTFDKPVALATGRTPIRFEPSRPVVFKDDDLITIEGVVEGRSPAAFLARLDDSSSTDYASRVNIEKQLPPGPFRLRISPKGLKTPNGRVLDHRSVTRIILASFDAAGTITISRFGVAPAPRLPAVAAGYALAGPSAPILPGLERIAPGDPRLLGGVLPVTRIAPDPAVASGLRGIDRVRLPTPGGRVRVSMLIEDPGEWEFLPHPLRRTIKVNGTIVLDHSLTPDQWIAQRYLRLANTEHTADDDAWTAYGRLRGNLVSTEVDSSDVGVVIEMTGDTADARYLSVVVVEPAGQSVGIDFVNEQRADWYRSTHPVARQADPKQRPQFPIRIGGGDVPVVRATTAAGGSVWLSLSLTTTAPIANPDVGIEPPQAAGTPLPFRAWAGQRRLELKDNLVLRDNRLISDLSRLPIDTVTPRVVELWVNVPAHAPAGLYRGSLEISGSGQRTRVPIEIEVLGVVLAAPAKPAGFYHFEPAQYHFFPALADRGRRETQCDLETLSFFGAAAGASPPGATMPVGKVDRMMDRMRIAHRGGVMPGWLNYDYTVDGSPDDKAKAIGAVSALMVTEGLGQPVWSVADEPSNPDQAQKVQDLVAAVRRHAPLARIGAQLNSPRDRSIVGLFDVSIINAGFGLDAATVDGLAVGRRSVWLYNTGHHRLAAGLWLWQTKAERYVQWHARSTVADPFDPLDGRESDFQVLYPSVQPCPAAPDIHRDLLRLADGLTDQRWLGWLDRQTSPDALRVRSEILRRIGQRWDTASQISPAGLDDIRSLVVTLARRTASAGPSSTPGAK